MIRIRAFLLVVVTLEARPVQAQRMMGQFRFSASAAVNVPISDLDKYGNAGFGIAVRTESPLGGPTWSLRSGVSYDRFGGKGGLGVDPQNALHRLRGSRPERSRSYRDGRRHEPEGI